MEDMDRVTQLQDNLEALGRVFFDSVGILQRDAPPVHLSSNPSDPVELDPEFQETPKKMAEFIVQTSKQLHAGFDLLPGISRTHEEQLQLLSDLEIENQKAEEELIQSVAEAKKYLSLIRSALQLMAEDNLNLNRESI